MNTGPWGVIWWRRACAYVAVVACVAGCGDDDGDGLRAPTPDAGAAVEPLALDEFCDDRLAAYCAEGEGCRSCDEGRSDEFYKQFCEASVQGVAFGLFRYDARQAARCVAAVSASRCFNNFRSFTPAECVDVFIAQAAPGSACATRGANPCRDGYCDTREACPGVCVAHRTVDQSCDDEDQRCSDDLYCEEGICKRRLPEGLSCELAPNACVYSLQCLPTEEDGGATCQALVAEGGACSMDEQCRWPLLCLDDRCVAEVERGDRCINSSNCPNDDRCYATPGSTEPARCQPVIEIGEECVSYDSCVDGARCVSPDGVASPVCALPDARGQACTNAGCSEGLVCLYGGDDPRCGDPQADGEPCSNHNECQSGVCRGQTCSARGAERDACTHGANECQDDLYCKGPYDGSAVCSAREPVGADCNEQYRTGAIVCREGSHCVCTLDVPSDCYVLDGAGWQCQALLELGDECAGHDSCESAVCVGGRCRARTELSGVENLCVEEEQP